MKFLALLDLVKPDDLGLRVNGLEVASSKIPFMDAVKSSELLHHVALTEAGWAPYPEVTAFGGFELYHLIPSGWVPN